MAFWGGVTAGALGLTLTEDPLRTWIEETSAEAGVSHWLHPYFVDLMLLPGWQRTALLLSSWHHFFSGSFSAALIVFLHAGELPGEQSVLSAARNQPAITLLLLAAAAAASHNSCRIGVAINGQCNSDWAWMNCLGCTFSYFNAERTAAIISGLAQSCCP